MNGSLRTRPLPVVLLDLSRSDSSGILTVKRARQKKQACLLRGTIRFADSNLEAERFGQFLRNNRIVEEDLLQAAEAGTESPTLLAPTLFKMDALPLPALREAVRRHIIDILLPCYDWPDGTWAFQEGIPNIAGQVNVELRVIELSLERARRRENQAGIARLSSSRRARIKKGGGVIVRDLEHANLTREERTVMELAGKEITVDEALSSTIGAEGPTLRALQALVDIGAVDIQWPLETRRPATAGVRSGTGAGDAAAADSASGPGGSTGLDYYRRLLKRLEGMNYYQLLGLGPRAKDDEIRSSYYQLARDLHPDRFGSPPLNTIRGEIERLFSEITQAYETLSNKESRETYDRNLLAETSPVSATDKKSADGVQHPAQLARENYLHARVLFESNRVAEALKFAENAVSIDGSRFDYRFLLGRIQSRNPRLRVEATKNLRKAVSMEPSRADVHLELGRLYLKMGKTDFARTHLEEVLKWDPGNLEAETVLKESGLAKSGGLRGLFGRSGS